MGLLVTVGVVVAMGFLHRLSENSEVVPAWLVAVADKHDKSVGMEEGRVIMKSPLASALPATKNCVPAGVESGFAKISI